MRTCNPGGEVVNITKETRKNPFITGAIPMSLQSEGQSSDLHSRLKELGERRAEHDKRLEELEARRSFHSQFKKPANPETLKQHHESITKSLEDLIFTNDEQRRYIETLKETIEFLAGGLKIDNILIETLGGNVSRAEALTKWIALNKELEKNAIEIAEKKKYIEDMEGLLIDFREQNNELQRRLMLAGKNYEDLRRDTSRKITESSKHVTDLEYEREVLLDYIEDIYSKKAKLDKDVRELKYLRLLHLPEEGRFSEDTEPAYMAAQEMQQESEDCEAIDEACEAENILQEEGETLEQHEVEASRREEQEIQLGSDEEKQQENKEESSDPAPEMEEVESIEKGENRNLPKE